MDIPIVIPCYFENDESREIAYTESQLGIEMDVDMDEIFDIKPVHFLHINYVFEHPNGKDTVIGSGFDDFRTPMKLKDVLKLLNK